MVSRVATVRSGTRHPLWWLADAGVLVGVPLVWGWISWTCPVYAITGHHCPSCGMTRAVRSLLQGDVGAAWHNNALLLVGVPSVTVWVLASRVGWLPRHPAWRWLGVGLVVGGVLAYTITRNTIAPGLAPIAIP